MSTINRLKTLFQGRRVIIPLLIGVAAGLLLIGFNFELDAITSFSWTSKVILWLSLAMFMLVLRDLGYIIRLRVLSDKELSWKQCFELTFLWEFASAISPGIVGGTAAAFVLLAQENINTGKSAAIVLATSFLDVVFYVILVPLLALSTDLTELIPAVSLPNGNEVSQNYILGYFYTAYGILVLWAVVVFVGLFVKPQLTRRVMHQIFKLKIFRKWKDKAQEWEEDLVETSKAFGKRKFKFWFGAFGSTVFSWVARFATVNFIVLAFGHSTDHFEIFSQQLILWCILILPVTPGASGLAETLFPSFLRPYFANQSLAKLGAVIWRIVSYYPYILIGFTLFPIWIKRIIKTQSRSKEA